MAGQSCGSNNTTATARKKTRATTWYPKLDAQLFVEAEKYHTLGKIGDLKSPPIFSDETYHFVVHFEDKNLKPTQIREENLHVVFELPDEK